MADRMGDSRVMGSKKGHKLPPRLMRVYCIDVQPTGRRPSGDREC